MYSHLDAWYNTMMACGSSTTRVREKRNCIDGSGEVDQMFMSSNYRKDSLIRRIISYLMAGRNCWAGAVLLPERARTKRPE